MYVNRELNSQIGIRSQDSYFSESDGASPTSMLLWRAAYRVRYVKHDANDGLCTTYFVVTTGCGTAAPECGTAALAVTAQIRTDTTQHVMHIKIYILAQLYHKRQHRLIYVHILHIYKVLKQHYYINRVSNGLSNSHLMETTLNGYKHDSSYSNLLSMASKKLLTPLIFSPFGIKHQKGKKRKEINQLTPPHHHLVGRSPNRCHHLHEQPHHHCYHRRHRSRSSLVLGGDQWK